MAKKKIAKGHFKKLPPSLQPQTKTPVGELVWKRIRIAGFSDYEISSFGVVRRKLNSLPPEHAGRILSPSLKDGMYPRVTLAAKTGERKSFTIHRLLAGEFLRRQKTDEVIRHLDARPQIPTAWTIAWGSAKANRNDHELHELFFTLMSPNKHILDRGAILIDILVLNKPLKTTAKKWGVTVDTIKALSNGQRHRVELEMIRKIIMAWEKKQPTKNGKSPNLPPSP